MNRLVLLALLATACGPRHIQPHSPRTRDYQPGEYEAAPVPVSSGSLWTQGNRGLFRDFRASGIGDLVTIRIDESVAASGEASTSMEREAQHDFQLGGALGFLSALTTAAPGVDPSALLQVMSDYNFDGDGTTERGSNVNGTISVRVKQLLPNGDFFIEGTKVILINDEELHVYVSGVIREQDIEQDNSIRSSLIADAQIEFTGRGSLSNNQRQGWLSRLISRVRPF
ncbi:MAG: flagellar basal body L-ring protein FlgH [Myxococcota bacterium]